MLLCALSASGFPGTDIRFMTICLAVEALLYLTLWCVSFNSMVFILDIYSMVDAIIRILGVFCEDSDGLSGRIWVAGSFS